MRTQLERESTTSTSYCQPPALGGDTHQLWYMSCTFTGKHWSSGCPRTVTARGIYTGNEKTQRFPCCTANPSVLPQEMDPKNRHIFQDVFVLKGVGVNGLSGNAAI